MKKQFCFPGPFRCTSLVPGGHLGGGSGPGTSRGRGEGVGGVSSCAVLWLRRLGQVTVPLWAEVIACPPRPHPHPQGLKFWDPGSRAALPAWPPSRRPGRGGREQRAKCQLYFCRTGHSGSPLPALFFFPFDEINYEHCLGSFDSGDTCQDKIFQKHLYLII